MAFILGDSFDLVNSTAALVASGVWSTANNFGVTSSNTRFSFGQSGFSTGYGSIVRDNLPASSGTVFLAFAYYNTTSTDYVQFRDGGNAQVTVMFNADNSITVRTGGTSGTVIATFASAYLSNIWTHFQIQAIIHPTAGEVHIRKNGNTVDDFAATGLNTREGTSNNYCTGVALGAPTGNTSYFDDFLMFDNSGTSLNTWTGDVRCYVLYPIANGSVNQFTPLISSPSPQVVCTGGSSVGLSNGVMWSSPSFTPSAQLILTTATISLSTSLTGNINVALMIVQVIHYLMLQLKLSTHLQGH